MVELLPIAKSLAIAFVAAGGLMPLARRACFRWQITAPRTIGEKAERVPSLGGPPIIAGALCGLAVTAGVPLWLGIPITMLCAAGVIDDIIVLTPIQKITAEAIAAAVLIFIGPRLTLSGYAPLDYAISGFWLLAVANAFNLIDGMDGLAGGIGVTTSVAIAAVAFWHGNLTLALIAGALAGALLGFLFFNIWPASIFMGDSGALPIGMMLGFITLEAGQSCVATPLARWVLPILLMLTPLLDTGVVTISRIATGRPISRGGHDHSHHRLFRLGLSTRRVVATCWAANALFVSCALVVSRATPIGVAAMLPFVLVSAAVVALFMANLTFDAIEPGKTYASMGGLAKVVLRCAYDWRIADIMLDGVTISAAYLGAYLIRLDFAIPEERFYGLLSDLPQLLIISYAALFFSGVYRSIWRYSELSDALRFAKASIIAGALLAAVRLWGGGPVSWSIVILFTILLCNLLIATRLSFTVFRRGVAHLAQAARTVLLVGAGNNADAALQFLMSSPEGGAKVIGILDNDPFKQGKLIRGVRVLGPLAEIDQVYQRSRFEELVLTYPSFTQAEVTFLQSFAHRTGVSVSNFTMGAHPQLETPTDLAVAGS
jgi:UDP-GlcNAc:undecaprenyl-phosphate/decaprenyl-phosphate GlcNAc-1-phosphate transferase